MKDAPRPPHAATIPATLPQAPHPATVQRRPAPFGAPTTRPPHPATLPQAPTPHPATAQRRPAPFGLPLDRPPHPAIVTPAQTLSASAVQRAAAAAPAGLKTAVKASEALYTKIVFWNVYRLGAGTDEKVRGLVLKEVSLQMNDASESYDAIYGLFCEVTSSSTTVVEGANVTLDIQGKRKKRGLGYAAVTEDFAKVDLAVWKVQTKGLKRHVMQVDGKPIYLLHANASSKAAGLVSSVMAELVDTIGACVLVGDLNVKDHEDLTIPAGFMLVKGKPTHGSNVLDFAIVPTAWAPKVTTVGSRLGDANVSDHRLIVLTFLQPT
jgi:hypothetical protein